MLCLNIGCGKDYRPSVPGDAEWVNIDANPAVKADSRQGIDVLERSYRDAVDFILARDVLEHVPYSAYDKTRWIDTLKSWWCCLKIGGTIEIQVPDPYLIFEKLRNGMISEVEFTRLVYGESTDAWDRHYQLISMGRLKTELENIGFRVLEENRLNICAIIKAIKE